MSDRQKTRARPNPRRAFAETYGAVLAKGIERRSVLKGLLALTAGAAAMPYLGRTASAAEASTLTFAELTRVRDREDHWPTGYSRQILARWGDGLFADSPAFDPATLDGNAAERQFGYNNDFTFFMPLPLGSASSEHG
ncbi:alkaline phosphatase PhoX [Ciceribacter selenitireducens]